MVSDILGGKTPFYSDRDIEYFMRYTLDALMIYRVLRKLNKPTDIYLLDGDRNLDPCGGSRFYPETAAMYEALVETLLLKLDIPFFVRGWIQYYACIDKGNIVIKVQDDQEGRYLASFIVQENNYWKTVYWNVKSVEENEMIKKYTYKAQTAFHAEITRRYSNG